jgi:hypothetical protein
VLAAIATEMQKAKYFIFQFLWILHQMYAKHIEQLTFILRYVKNAVPKELFLQFIPIYGHKAVHLADVITSFLKDNNISLMNCRGQLYDNAANMHYSGLQARLKRTKQICFIRTMCRTFYKLSWCAGSRL